MGSGLCPLCDWEEDPITFAPEPSPGAPRSTGLGEQRDGANRSGRFGATRRDAAVRV
jgi:hypothetical protein